MILKWKNQHFYCYRTVQCSSVISESSNVCVSKYALAVNTKGDAFSEFSASNFIKVAPAESWPSNCCVCSSRAPVTELTQ